jgi:hypothetical protein
MTEGSIADLGSQHQRCGYSSPASCIRPLFPILLLRAKGHKLARCGRLLLRGSGGPQLRHKQLCLALRGLHLKYGAKGRGGGAGLKTFTA